MGMQVTIGGKRLGGGKEMTTNLHGYKRSTHNLDTRFLSSIAPGVLVPFYCNVGLKGDTFDIDMQAAVRTLPTQGPLFGSFKLQADWFICPLRLYQGILHNNPINLGLNMNRVFLPKITLKGRANRFGSLEKYQQQISNNCLLKYIGFSGFPSEAATGSDGYVSSKKINATPILAYYDIFKNYYANKQEEKAYVITPNLTASNTKVNDNYTLWVTGEGDINWGEEVTIASEDAWRLIMKPSTNWKESVQLKDIYMHISAPYDGMDWYGTADKLIEQGLLDESAIELPVEPNVKTVVFNEEAFYPALWKIQEKESSAIITDIKVEIYQQTNEISKKINLKPFDLINIDKVRQFLLSKNELGNEVDLGGFSSISVLYPYRALHSYNEGVVRPQFTSANEAPMNGLCVKTYQSDIFNNWLKTEFIEGEDSITELTRIDTSNGLTMDVLNITEKIYDMLNRIVTAGGTYQDWEEVNYDEKAKRLCETPMWVGGYSDEIIFDEVIQTSESGETPLGKLGGRGRSAGNRHGGHIKFKVEEASVIMGIISITPRVAYSQGNAWYLNELNSIDDLHKPALDGIGFQDLITEQMAHFDTLRNSVTGMEVKQSAGKVPAWLNYMTDVDRVFGDFAAGGQAEFMVLGRNYEIGEDINDTETFHRIKDLTTYIDPAKFNYAFAYAELDAQNFWVNVNSHITARRKMSAKIIPNL